MENVYISQMSVQLDGSRYYYFPYSAGVVWSYAQSIDDIRNNYSLKDIFFKKEPIDDLVKKIINPKILALSSYVWNDNYNLELAKTIKKKYKDCKVIIGGAAIPNNNVDYFKKNPFVDYIIHQEGEISFSKLLLSNIYNTDINEIPGISYEEKGKFVTTGKSERIASLDMVPSPYLSGVFDKIQDQYKNDPNVVLNGIIETNRGCPFKCTFCDWGGVIHQKVKKFDTSRIENEIKWFSDNKIEYINNTDANFGIFKDRDMAVVDYLIETKKETGYPKIFDTNWNKNNNAVTINMAKKLVDNNLLRRFTASLQSMNSEVLKAIKRVNLNNEQLDNIVLDAKKNGVSVNTELIIGLPKETYESFQQGVCELLEKNIIVEAYPLIVLDNSEMNDPEYKKKYGIKMQYTKSHFGQYVDEYNNVVIETRDLPASKFKRIWVWNWLTLLLETNGFTHLIARYLKKKYNIDFYLFYEKILEVSLMNSTSVFNAHALRWKQYADDLKFHYFIAGFVYADVLQDIGISQRKLTFKELKEIAQSLIGKDDPLLSDVVKLQELQQVIPGREYPVYHKSLANVYEYIMTDTPLVKENMLYKIYHDKIEDRFKSWIEFMNFSRKNRGWESKITVTDEVKYFCKKIAQ